MIDNGHPVAWSRYQAVPPQILRLGNHQEMLKVLSTGAQSLWFKLAHDHLPRAKHLLPCCPVAG